MILLITSMSKKCRKRPSRDAFGIFLDLDVIVQIVGTQM